MRLRRGPPVYPERASAYHLDHIERQADMLASRVVAEQASLTAFTLDYCALSALQWEIRRTLNLPRDLPADFETQRTSG